MEVYTGRIVWKGSRSSEFNWEFSGCNAEETEEMKYYVTMAVIDTNIFCSPEGRSGVIKTSADLSCSSTTCPEQSMKKSESLSRFHSEICINYFVRFWKPEDC